MKRILSAIVLAVIAIAASCQERNKLLQHLEGYLEQQGFIVEHSQTSQFSGGVRRSWSIPLNVISNIRTDNKSEEEKQLILSRNDSINAIKRKKNEEAIDTIRLTFALLAKEASESYTYEYHMNGIDTIWYTMAFRKENDTLQTSRFGNMVFINNARENAWFQFYREGLQKRENGILKHTITTPNDIKPQDKKTFNAAAFEEYIQPVIKSILKLKGAKSHTFYWRHDEGFFDYVGGKGGLIRAQWDSNARGKSHGISTGTCYYIPSKYEEEAKVLHEKLDSMTYEYVNSHPEEFYEYYFRKDATPRNLNDIVQGWGNVRDGLYYNLQTMRDEDGLHILSITTEGHLWIPRDWQRLKSYINGKKVYLKGM